MEVHLFLEGFNFYLVIFDGDTQVEEDDLPARGEGCLFEVSSGECSDELFPFWGMDEVFCFLFVCEVGG